MAKATQSPLLQEIKAFLRDSGMAATTFGQRISGNSHLVSRLENGGTVTLPVAEKIEAFITQERKRLKKKTRPFGREPLPA